MNLLPHLDKSPAAPSGHYSYIAYQNGISSLLSGDMTVKSTVHGGTALFDIINIVLWC